AEVVVERRVVRALLQLLERVERGAVVRVEHRVEVRFVDVPRGRRGGEDEKREGASEECGPLHPCPFAGAGRPTSRTFPSWVCTSNARRRQPVLLRISSACFRTSSSNFS